MINDWKQDFRPLAYPLATRSVLSGERDAVIDVTRTNLRISSRMSIPALNSVGIPVLRTSPEATVDGWPTSPGKAPGFSKAVV